MKDFKKMPKMADGGSVDEETKKYVKPGRPDLSGDSRGLLSRLKESKEKPAFENTVQRATKDLIKGTYSEQPTTKEKFAESVKTRLKGGSGSMGGGDMSGMKGLDKPYKRGGKVKK